MLGDKWDTSFLSIGHLPTDEFIRSRVRNPAEPADRIRRDARQSFRDWFTRTIYIRVYVCTRAERPRRYRDGDLTGPRASYRSTQSVAAVEL